jgi:hypothetical protein
MDKKLQYAIKTLNTLDVYDAESSCVHFYADEDHKRKGGLASSLSIQIHEHEKSIQVRGSACLPSQYWRNHAAAVRRAEEFLMLSCFKDH